MDLFGAMGFLSFALFVIKFLKTKRLIYAGYSGFFVALACNFRTAYQYGIMVFVGILVCCVFGYILKRKKEMTSSLSWKRREILQVILGVSIFLLAFLVVSYPQYQINSARGIEDTMLPYDYVGGWQSSLTTRDTTLMESSANSRHYTGYPHAVSDSQIAAMKTDSGYGATDFLTVQELLGVYSERPIETLVYIFKKLFLAFDPKTSVTYPDKVNWRTSEGLSFSLLNYIVIGSALYSLLKQRSTVKKEERLLVLSMFAGLVMPQMFVHVEWRYFLSSYIILYYFFSYHFVAQLLIKTSDEEGVLETEGYLKYICGYVFASFVLSITLFI